MEAAGTVPVTVLSPGSIPHRTATYNCIRGGTPSNGFQSGTLRMSLVCDIVKMRKVLNQNPLLGVPLMLRHCEK